MAAHGQAARSEWSFSGRRGPLMVLLCGVLVSALVAGGFGVWHVVKDDDGASPGASDPKQPGGDDEPGEEPGEDPVPVDDGSAPLPDELIEAQLLLQQEQPGPREAEEDIITYAPGWWMVDDHMVRVMDYHVVSTDLATGEVAWTFPLDRGKCGVSPQQSNHRIVLMQGRDCENMTVLDIARGEPVWTTPVPSASTKPNANNVPVIFGDYVAIAWTPGGAGWNISEEALVWEPQQTDACRVESYAVFEEAVVEHKECGSFSLDGMPGEVTGRDEDGNELWTWSYDAEHEGEPLRVDAVLSAEPLVVQVGVGKSLERVTQLWVIDDAYRKVDRVLAFDEEKHLVPCERRDYLNDCPGAVLHDGMLYLAGSETDNSVLAFELATGTALWQVKPLGDVGGQVLPVRELNGKILAYQLATYDLPGMVIAIDPETEQAEPVMVLPAEHFESEREILRNVRDFEGRAYWHNNRFFLLTQSFFESGIGKAATLVYG
jgi:hypothetical protein